MDTGKKFVVLKGAYFMKKTIYHGIGDIRIEEIADPMPGPGEVKVKIK